MQSPASKHRSKIGQGTYPVAARPFKLALVIACYCIAFIFSTWDFVPSRADSLVEQAATSYVLHANDQLLISVLGHDDYTKTVTILSDGTFDYPVVGIVPAAGKTVSELTEYLQTGLKVELNEPQVTISVTQYSVPVVNVVGAVGKAGAYTFVHDWHVIDAIAAAQGLSGQPGTTSITLVRTGSEPVQIDAAKLMSGADAADNPPVFPGDSLLVQQRDVNATGVRVSGEVKIPDVYPVPAEGEPLLAALDAAGGALDDAALSQVQLSHDGQVLTLNLVDVNDSIASDSSLPIVQQGDVLLVPRISERIAVLGAVNEPQDYYIPEGKPLTVAGAIALAKGNTLSADLSKIVISRIVNGKIQTTAEDLPKILRGDNPGGDIILQSGDVVYVPVKGAQTNDSPLIFLLGPLVSLLK